jgi:prepilin-type N-terminal cleavage/methylation domain-containing protein
MSKMKTHPAGNERGFTLIELAVVTMILAILVAIGLPSVLGFRARANEARVMADLTHVAIAEGGILALDGGYSSDEARIEPLVRGIDIGNATDTSVRVVVADVDPGDGAQVLLYARAVSGSWFGLRLVGVGADIGRHTCRSDVEADMTIAVCTGTDW